MADNSLRCGIFSFAHGHAWSYASALMQMPDFDLAGIWDADPARGAQMASQFGTRYFEKIQDLLDERLDGAMVCTENAYHSEVVGKAAASGVRAIICEKPLATTKSDAAHMVTVCKEANVTLSTAFPCRYSAAFQRLLAAKKDGTLGEILAIRATNHGNCPMGWFVELEKSGGGALIDHTVHVADLNRVLLGSEATECYAEVGSGIYHQKWEDCAFLSITYAGPVFCTLDSSWSRPPKSFPIWGDVTMEVIGTGGVATIDLFGQNLSWYSEESGHTRFVGWGSNLDAGLIADFLKTVKGEPAPMIATGEDGMRAAEVAFAAYESVRAGQPIKL